MDDKKIILISCGHFDKEMTDLIAEDISREFQYRVDFRECIMDLSNYYNPARRQYDANTILQEVSMSSPAEYTKKMGLLRVDLYIPILTYLFGQALLNGDAGIASLYRLRNELYGLEQNHHLLTERFRKVVVHELGHTFGLIHCQNPVCVMRSSTYVEDIDQKGLHFCHKCRSFLDQN